MFQNDLKEYLLNSLTNKKVVSGNKQIVTRCPFCGDSSSIDSMHFYIGPFDGDETHPIWYNCRRCYISGIFNSDILKRLDIYSIDAGTMVSKHNRSSQTHGYNKNTKSFRVSTPIVNNQSKIGYINSRLGANLTAKDCANMKIIINLYDLLYANNITTVYQSDKVIDELEDHYIGFLSADNSMITFRNIVEDNEYRYIDYKLFGQYGKRIYTIPTQIDLYSIEPLKIFITEGPFDALGLYLNTDNPKTNTIYSAALGKGDFTKSFEFFASDLGLINVEYHLCLDNDMKGWEIPYILRVLDQLNVNCYMHNNAYPGEKDFGVPRDRIKESVKQVLQKRV